MILPLPLLMLPPLPLPLMLRCRRYACCMPLLLHVDMLMSYACFSALRRLFSPADAADMPCYADEVVCHAIMPCRRYTCHAAAIYFDARHSFAAAIAFDIADAAALMLMLLLAAVISCLRFRRADDISIDVDYFLHFLH